LTAGEYVLAELWPALQPAGEALCCLQVEQTVAQVSGICLGRKLRRRVSVIG